MPERGELLWHRPSTQGQHGGTVALSLGHLEPSVPLSTRQPKTLLGIIKQLCEPTGWSKQILSCYLLTTCTKVCWWRHRKYTFVKPDKKSHWVCSMWDRITSSYQKRQLKQENQWARSNRKHLQLLMTDNAASVHPQSPQTSQSYGRVSRQTSSKPSVCLLLPPGTLVDGPCSTLPTAP